MTVRAAKAEVAVDGRVIHSGRLDPQGSPWLVLRSGSPQGEIRDLAFDGRPIVPGELDLATGPTLESWWALDPTGEGEANTGAWLKVGDEIRGRRSTDSPGHNRESVLLYTRPLSGEDSIEYEFLSKTGENIVHPVLGRIAFLLEPDGIAIHQLAGGELASDNRRVEPAWRRGPARPPLIDGGWNRLRLALSGDKVTIELNGVLVHESPFDRAEPRPFGFFHFADQTVARVRRVRLRGSWAKQLPERGDFLKIGTTSQPPGKP